MGNSMRQMMRVAPFAAAFMICLWSSDASASWWWEPAPNVNSETVSYDQNNMRLRIHWHFNRGTKRAYQIRYRWAYRTAYRTVYRNLPHGLSHDLSHDIFVLEKNGMGAVGVFSRLVILDFIVYDVLSRLVILDFIV